MTPTKLYRYHNRGNDVILEGYPVLRATLKGVWIQRPYDKDRWVSHTGRIRYAHETKELAWASFLRRKKNHLAHLRRTVGQIENIISASSSKGNRIPEKGDSYGNVRLLASPFEPDSSGYFYDYDDPEMFSFS